MSDDQNRTPAGEPGSDAATSTAEPASRSGAESTPSTPSPSVEELQERIKRLEANVSGTTKEWQKERAERERLQTQMAQAPQYQPPAQPPEIEPEFRVLAKKLTKAVYDGQEDEVADTLRAVAARPVTQFSQYLQQASIQGAKQQGLHHYLASVGVKPGDPIYEKAQKRYTEAASDPKYAFVADNPVALSAVIVNEIRADSATARRTAEEVARDAAVEGGATEGTKGGGLPGKKPEPVEKMYFDEGDLKMIRHAMRADKISEEEAKKRRWAHMDARVKAARVEAGKAV
jgi:hypothetical protein